MKIAVLIARILLGLVFLVFGLNDFFHFMPNPPIPGDAGVLANIMFAHGWFTFHGILYTIAGALLLIGRYVPVGLVILGPILVNVLLPGGATATGMVPDEMREKLGADLLDPAIMGPPIVWLASADAVGVHDQRIIARDFEDWLKAR